VLCKPLFEAFIIFVAFTFQESQNSLAFNFKFWTYLFIKCFDEIRLYLFNLLDNFFLQKVIYDLFIAELRFIFSLLFLFVFALLLFRNLSFRFRMLLLGLFLRFFLFNFTLLLIRNLRFCFRWFLRFLIFFMCLDPWIQIFRLERSSLSNLLFNEFVHLIIGYLNFVRCEVLFYYLFFRFVLLFWFLFFFFYLFMNLLYFAFFGFLLDVCFCLCLFFILWLVLSSLW